MVGHLSFVMFWWPWTSRIVLCVLSISRILDASLHVTWLLQQAMRTCWHCCWNLVLHLTGKYLVLFCKCLYNYEWTSELFSMVQYSFFTLTLGICMKIFTVWSWTWIKNSLPRRPPLQRCKNSSGSQYCPRILPYHCCCGVTICEVWWRCLLAVAFSLALQILSCPKVCPSFHFLHCCCVCDACCAAAKTCKGGRHCTMQLLAALCALPRFYYDMHQRLSMPRTWMGYAVQCIYANFSFSVLTRVSIFRFAEVLRSNLFLLESLSVEYLWCP